jgi:N-acetylglucosamine-6-phosphate deacetylase
LISDASSYAGMATGRYQDWGTEIEVLPDRRVGLAGTPYLAGSCVTLLDCVRWAGRNGLDWTDAVHAAAVGPRSMFGLPTQDRYLLLDLASDDLPRRFRLSRVVENELSGTR